jgi:hypothetical protein
MNILQNWPHKAISIRQPWAWLICNFKGIGGEYPHGIPPKRIENRPTLKHIKGALFIHAGATFDKDGYSYLRNKILGAYCPGWMVMDFLDMLPEPGQFERGGIVGWAEFTGECVRDSDNFWYAPGQNGLLIATAGSLPFHKCKGRLSIFPVDFPRPWIGYDLGREIGPATEEKA